MSNSLFRLNVNANVNNGYNNRRFEKRPAARPRIYYNKVNEFENKYNQSRGVWYIAKNKEEQDQDQENADIYKYKQLIESYKETNYYFSSPTILISYSKYGTYFNSRNNLFQYLYII